MSFDALYYSYARFNSKYSWDWTKKSLKEERENLICIFESGYHFLGMQMKENVCLFVLFNLDVLTYLSFQLEKTKQSKKHHFSIANTFNFQFKSLRLMRILINCWVPCGKYLVIKILQKDV